MSGNCSAAFLERLVDEALVELGERGERSAAQIGTQLNSIVTRRLRAEGMGIGGLRRFHVGRTFRTFGISPQLAQTTIEDFVGREVWHMADLLRPLFKRVRKDGSSYLRKIGNLMPDLMAELPDGSYIVWDLTSRSVDEHIAKTILYAEVASASRGGLHVRIGEMHYRPR